MSWYNCTRISCLTFWYTICHVTFLWRWLRLVGSLKLPVSFVEYRLLYKALLQKRLVIYRSLLIVATPYASSIMSYIFMYDLSRHIAKHHLARHFPHTYIKHIMSYTPPTNGEISTREHSRRPREISRFSICGPRKHRFVSFFVGGENLHSFLIRERRKSPFVSRKNLLLFLFSWAERISICFAICGRRDCSRRARACPAQEWRNRTLVAHEQVDSLHVSMGK